MEFATIHDRSPGEASAGLASSLVFWSPTAGLWQGCGRVDQFFSISFFWGGSYCLFLLLVFGVSQYGRANPSLAPCPISCAFGTS